MRKRVFSLALALTCLVFGLVAGCGLPQATQEPTTEQGGGKSAVATEQVDADVGDDVGDDVGESARLDQDDDDDDADRREDDTDDADVDDDDDDDNPAAPGGGICGAIPAYGQATLSSVEEITSGALIDQLEQMGKIDEVYVYRTGDAATQVKEHYVQAMEDAGWAIVFEMDVAGDLLLIWSNDDLMAQLVIGSDEGLTTFILGCGPNG
jgi:hypothetical protein